VIACRPVPLCSGESVEAGAFAYTAGEFRCFFGEKSFDSQELKNSRTQELKKNQQSRAEARIAAFFHS
jgi:hypothetical protein